MISVHLPMLNNIHKYIVSTFFKSLYQNLFSLYVVWNSVYILHVPLTSKPHNKLFVFDEIGTCCFKLILNISNKQFYILICKK